MKDRKLQVRTLVQASSACVLLLAGSVALAAPFNSLARPAPNTTTMGTGGSGQDRHGADVTGTITAIDATAGTITITPAGGTATTIALTTATVLVGHEAISGSSIALGDTLEVSGIPLSLQVSGVTDDHVNTASSPGTTTTTAAAAGTPATAAAAGTTMPASAVPGTLRVRGTVSSLNPPTITINNSFSLALSVSSGTAYSESVSITASQLAVGDTVVAQVSGRSTLTATKLDVTAPAS